MRIIFMGTPEFAVASLEALIKNNFQVVGVITAPDKPAGRGQVVQESAVKRYAVANQLPVMQPVNLKDENFINDLQQLKADLQIVVAFRMLPERIWNMPPLGTFNLHVSLLPKYRGAAPINWAIINGEKESGVTTFKLVHEIDAGNILLQQRISIPHDMNAGSLHDIMKKVGADLIVQTAQMLKESFEKGTELHFTAQNTSTMSHAPKLFKETCRIDWNKDALSIYNLIRGLSPYPTAFTEFEKGNQKLNLKIFEVDYEICEHQYTNGSLITDNKSFLKVSVHNGFIVLQDIQLQGKKRMKTIEFLRGYKFEVPTIFLSRS